MRPAELPYVRRIDVPLGPALEFHLEEALFQPRPDHWARLWHSAIALSQWLLEQPPGSFPTSARELGCGIGLVGVTLRHLGVDVESTDRVKLAVQLAAHNGSLNGLPLTTRHLDFGEAADGNFRTPMLVASDIVYEAGAPALLCHLIHDAGMLLPSGLLVIAAPRRRSELLAQLLARLTGCGYSHHQTTRAVQWAGDKDEIDIHVLRRPG